MAVNQSDSVKLNGLSNLKIHTILETLSCHLSLVLAFVLIPTNRLLRLLSSL